jgi:hypothetical protein
LSRISSGTNGARIPLSSLDADDGGMPEAARMETAMNAKPAAESRTRDMLIPLRALGR